MKEIKDYRTNTTKCIYCLISEKGYWHWTHAYIYTVEAKEVLCKCEVMVL